MFSVLFAECAGTSLLMTCILMTSNPIAIAIGLVAAIYAFGKVSNGHFNPAVSLMMFLKGDINMYTFITYIAAQLVGAILALLWWRSTIGNKKKYNK